MDPAFKTNDPCCDALLPTLNIRLVGDCAKPLSSVTETVIFVGAAPTFLTRYGMVIDLLMYNVPKTTT